MKRILFVDDDIDTLRLIDLTLSRRGYQVSTASSGSSALKALQNDVPDLILLDLMMPMMNGYELCRRVRANPRTAHLPIVVLSAKVEPESQVEAFRCGATGYLIKPVSSDELTREIENALQEASVEPVPQALGTTLGTLGSRGGVGATTIATNVAVALAEDRDVVIVDLVPDGAVAAYLGLEPTRHLGPLLSEPIEAIDRESVIRYLLRHPSGLHVLAAPPSPALGLDGYRARTIIARLLEEIQVVIIDLGVRSHPVARSMLSHCSAMAFVVGCSPVELAQARRTLSSLMMHEETEKTILPVCLSQGGRPDEIDVDSIHERLGRRPFASIHVERQHLHRAIENGVPLVLQAPRSAASRALRDLSRALLRTARENDGVAQ